MKDNQNQKPKSDYLSTIQVIILGISIFSVLIEFFTHAYVLIAVSIVSGVILCITLQIFITIIDLLQSINDKLDR